MGCFDTVTVDCKCGGTVEFQSKVGYCYQGDFTLETAPARILADIADQTASCPECDRTIRIIARTFALAQFS